MELSLNTNIQALISKHNLYIRTNQLNKDLKQASTGHKINSSADDAAGVSLSEGLLSNMKGRKVNVQAAQDGINILKVAEGSLSTIAEHIQRIRELSIQAANDVNTSIERRSLVEEINYRLQDIDRIANTTQAGHTKLLDGSASQFRIQVGIDPDVNLNTIQIGDVLVNSASSAIGFSGLNITAGAGGIFADGNSIRNFINTVDNTLRNLTQRRSQIASYENRLDSTVNNVTLSIESYSKSYSSIKDANLADVTSDMLKQKILRESTISILMQANSNSGVVLNLLAA